MDAPSPKSPPWQQLNQNKIQLQKCKEQAAGIWLWCWKKSFLPMVFIMIKSLLIGIYLFFLICRLALFLQITSVVPPSTNKHFHIVLQWKMRQQVEIFLIGKWKQDTIAIIGETEWSWERNDLFVCKKWKQLEMIQIEVKCQFGKYQLESESEILASSELVKGKFSEEMGRQEEQNWEVEPG